MTTTLTSKWSRGPASFLSVAGGDEAARGELGGSDRGGVAELADPVVLFGLVPALAQSDTDVVVGDEDFVEPRRGG